MRRRDRRATLPLTPQEWEGDDVRQRLVDVILNGLPPDPRALIGLLADAANEIEWLRARQGKA